MLIAEVTYNNLINYLGFKLTHFDLDAIEIVIAELVKNCLYEKEVHRSMQEIFVETEKTLRSTLFKKQVSHCLLSCEVLPRMMSATSAGRKVVC
jgi:hypothetical protein